MIPDFTSLNYFNLSPQGDGNLDITEDAAIDGISTYPRKGTETLNFFAKIEERQISTYPRKGTETSLPARTKNPAYISAYPRKGTETYQYHS